MFSVGLTVEDAVRDGYDEYFEKIDSCLKEELGGDYSPEDEHTDVALKFEIQQYGAGSIGVDLILSPFFSSQDELLRKLRDVHVSKRLKM